ncbi:MAG: hypothetical protein JF593_04055 [Novosphingobium sp.]|nr:hypothetical protein [Novosphingobium sp.]
MKRLGAILAVAGLLAGRPALAQQTQAQAQSPAMHMHGDEAAPLRPQLLEGYGSGGFPITTRVSQAQAFFDNGMQLAAAFAHKAAIAAMAEAVRLDPACAMCLWGEAFVSGPTINYGKDAKEREPLYAMAFKADALARTAGTDRERALTAALLLRYRPGTPVAARDAAFDRAMEALAARFPRDDSIVVLAADAALETIGEDREGVAEGRRAMALLEPVLVRRPEFTPAIHFYIHATEIAGVPGKAEPYADRLAALAPNASHLVHMPSHTWYWIGRYQDAADANVRAVEIGKTNARRLGLAEPDGVWGLPYHAHNVIFGLGGAMMAGDARTALMLAQPLVAHAQARAQAAPGEQLLAASGYFALGRFAPPDAVLALPEPKLPYLKAARHYARGEVLARTSDLGGARAELAAIPEHLVPGSGWGAKAAEEMLGITRATLAGRIAMDERRWDDAAASFRHAAETEESRDFTRFFDPPAFWYPVRRDLAAALLASGDAAGAEREARSSLKLRPRDAVAEQTLAAAQERLGRGSGAAVAR